MNSVVSLCILKITVYSAVGNVFLQDLSNMKLKEFFIPKTHRHTKNLHVQMTIFLQVSIVGTNDSFNTEAQKRIPCNGDQHNSHTLKMN